MAHRIAGSDIGEINRWGRLYTRDGSSESLEKAAEYLALCTSEEERASVRWWWNEGCRDYADSMKHLDQLNADLEAAEAKFSMKHSRIFNEKTVTAGAVASLIVGVAITLI